MSIETSQFTNHAFAQSEEIDLRGQVLNNLLNVSTYLGSMLDPNELLSGLAQRVVEAVPAIQAGMVWLYDRQQGALRVASLYGPDLESQRDAVWRLRLRPGEGLVGAAMKRGESLLVESRTRYREMSGNISQPNLVHMRALFETLPRDLTAVVLPLRIGNETIGVVELLNLGHSPPLRGQDLQVLQTFANLAAGAIKNAQLHAQMQAQQRRLEAFGAIGTAVSAAADLGELMDNALDVILGLVGTSAGAIILYDPARSVLTVGAFRNMPDAHISRYAVTPVAGTSCEEAVRYGQPICRPLLPEGEELALIEHGLSSAVYLPLLAGGTVTSVLCMYGDMSLYERVDVQTLMMMGSLIGFAIANVVLYYDSNSERRRLLTLINSITEGVALFDGQGQLVLANETARSLLSLDGAPAQQPFNEIPDLSGFRNLQGAPLPVDQLPMARALAGEVFQDYRVLLPEMNGRDKVMSFSGAPVYNEGSLPDGAVVVFRDVTALHRVELAKDDFLAVAAHELRSPLAAVRSYADLLVRREQSRGDDDSTELRGLNILAQQVTHMLHMVDNLLDVSRLDADQLSLDLQRVDLVALVRQVLEQQRPSAEDRVLDLESERQAVYAVCDPLRIRQVLTNLVSNAMRYSPSRSPITVSLSLTRANVLAEQHRGFAEMYQQRDAPSDEPMALIAVEDQGTGISDEQSSYLFKRYARGRKGKGEGLGLGLYLSREFVLRHGGVIWVVSRSGEGSVFYVALPLVIRET